MTEQTQLKRLEDHSSRLVQLETTFDSFQDALTRITAHNAKIEGAVKELSDRFQHQISVGKKEGAETVKTVLYAVVAVLSIAGVVGSLIVTSINSAVDPVAAQLEETKKEFSSFLLHQRQFNTGVEGKLKVVQLQSAKAIANWDWWHDVAKVPERDAIQEGTIKRLERDSIRQSRLLDAYADRLRNQESFSAKMHQLGSAH